MQSFHPQQGVIILLGCGGGGVQGEKENVKTFMRSEEKKKGVREDR